jgi:prepilin-type N-terminal cleavage/methylation domain-containing protein
MDNKFRLSKGFTLVELSIVIIIIGFLIAGIAGGNSLIQNAKLSTAVRDIASYESAILQFKNRYDYYPGDMLNAESYWPTAHNGDGDGYVVGGFNLSGPFEDIYAWQDLSLSGLITQQFTGTVISPRMAIGENTPIFSAGSKPAGFMLLSLLLPHGPHYGTRGLMLEMGAVEDSTGFTASGFLSAIETHSLDEKIDDGLASTGKFYGLRGHDVEGVNSCTDALYYDPLPVNYLYTDSAATCRIFYWIEKY